MTAAGSFETMREWYLARLRKNALAEAVGASTLTPGSLIQADRDAVESVVASKVAARVSDFAAPLMSQVIVWLGGLTVLSSLSILGAYAAGYVDAPISQPILLGFCAWCTFAMICLLVHYQSRLSRLKLYLDKASLSGDKGPSLNCEQAASTIVADRSNLVERLNLIADYSSAVVCMFDQDFVLQAVSPSITKIWNCSSIDRIGKSIEDLLEPGQFVAWQEQMVNVRNNSREKIFDACITCGSGVTLETRWNVEWSESRQSYFAVIEDVSAEKELERLRNEFVVVISHDIRTPLSSIKLVLQMLLDGLYGRVNEHGEARIGESLESCVFILDMIADLIDLHRLDVSKPQLRYSDVNMQELIGESIRSVSSLAAAKNMQVRSNVGGVDCALDAVRIKRVFVNLLSNAIKFSPDQSSVYLHSLADDEFITIMIRDEGPGIDPESIHQLFSRFSATSNPESRRDGSGLGLFVSKSLVEAHGGAIKVRSEVGKGTNFEIMLPRFPRELDSEAT
jgi:signal transduction histidine kinase